MRNHRSWLVFGITLIVLVVMGQTEVCRTLGQGGDPRKTNTNSGTTTPKKKTTAKKTPARRTTRSTTSGSKSTPTEPVTNSSPPITNTEPELWEAIRNSADVQDFKDYLQAFPSGAHAVIARTKIRQLEAAKSTPTTNPSTTNRSTANLSLPNRRTNQTGIEFVLIPPGSFAMGSTNGEADEKPVHQVTINYSFYMGKYEVTQAQWQSVMGSDPSNFKDCANCPVEQVSWGDAQQFINKLNESNDGFKYRLPT